ncbi:hypothetical protein M2427_002390 [Bradyrhizobium sp. BR13661]|jgi:hypothetical protein|nr:hypothetical protein [Bradyrhizobium sp. BR13661]
MRAVIVSLGSAYGTHEGQDARATLGTIGLGTTGLAPHAFIPAPGSIDAAGQGEIVSFA